MSDPRRELPQLGQVFLQGHTVSQEANLGQVREQTDQTPVLPRLAMDGREPDAQMDLLAVGTTVGHHLPAARRPLAQTFAEQPAQPFRLLEQFSQTPSHHLLLAAPQDLQRRRIDQTHDARRVEGHHPGVEAPGKALPWEIFVRSFPPMGLEMLELPLLTLQLFQHCLKGVKQNVGVGGFLL